MVSGFVLGVLSILTTWLLLIAISSGIGLLLRRGFDLPQIHIRALLSSFWLGTALIVLFLQVWHFFFPITWYAFAVVLAVGVAGLVGSARELREWFHRVTWEKPYALLAVLVLATVWAANNAMGRCSAYDSGMYHLPAINWAKSFPIVPGLGNLHGRLAFNNSSLLYAAMVDIGPWSGRSNHIANGMFLVVLLIQIIVSLFGLPRAAGSSKALSLFNITLLAPVVILIRDRDYIASFNTDTPTAVVLFVAASGLFGQIASANRLGVSKENAYNVLVLTTLLTTAVCLKLSAVGFALVGWCLALGWWMREQNRTTKWTAKPLGWILAISVALGLSWLGRGVILSGYPAYPSRLGAMPVEWRVPAEQAEAEEAWIGHYARSRNRESANQFSCADQVAMKWKWVGPWVDGLIGEPDSRWQIGLPALLAGLLFPIYGLLRCRSKANSRTTVTPAAWLMLLPTLTGIIFWFFIAPRPTFGFAVAWILVALCAAQFVNIVTESGTSRLIAPLLAGGIVIGTLSLELGLAKIASDFLRHGKNPVNAVLRKLIVKPGSDLWFQPTPSSKLGLFTTEPGLRLYVPEGNENRCFNAPLPCTPHPAPNLRLRKTDSLRSGFVTDGAWRALRWPNPETSFLWCWRHYRAGTGTQMSPPS